MDKKTIFTYTKHIGTYFSASLIPMILNLVSNPFIAMNMAPRDYAIVGYYSSFTSLVQPLIIFYMVQYYLRNYFNVTPEERIKLRATVFKALLGYSMIMTILCYIGISAYIHLFNPNIEFPIFPYLALTLLPIPLTGIYHMQTADYRMEKNTKAFFNIHVTYAVIQIALNLLFVVLIKWGAFGKLLAPLITNFVFFLYVLYKNRKYLGIKVDMKDFMSLMSFCWPLALGAMLGYFTGGYDKTYLESLKDTTTYGIYIVASQMAGYIHVFTGAVGATFQPDVYQAIMKGWKSRLIKTYAVQMGFILFVVIVYIILCPYVIGILTAGRYVDATPFSRVIAFSTFASALYFNINGYTICKGYPMIYTITTAVGSLVIIGLMPIMITKFQFFGAAYMTSISYLIMSVINVVLLMFMRYKKRFLS